MAATQTISIAQGEMDISQRRFTRGEALCQYSTGRNGYFPALHTYINQYISV